MSLYNRNEILKDSLLVVNKLVKSLANAQYIDDLRQEVLLILCELPEDKLISLYTRGELLRYTVGIIKNQYNSKTSTFYRKYKLYNLIRQDLNENNADD